MKSIRLTFPQRLASIVAAFLLSACGGGGSGGSPTPANPTPIINMSMSTSTAFTGQTTTLTWSASNASSCTGSGNWSGTQATSGSLTVNATQVGELSYSLNCSGAGGSATQTSKLAVTQSPLTLIAGNIGGPGSADGIGGNARFDTPIGIARDKSGNLFVTDKYNHTIRKITPSGLVSTFAGQVAIPGSADGEAGKALFNEPNGITIDASDNLYVADNVNHLIRKISPAGVVTTLAGKALELGKADGTSSAARFNSPADIAIDNQGNLIIADQFNSLIRKISSTGQVTTLAGNPNSSGFADGPAKSAMFRLPVGIAIDRNNTVYVADTYNNMIRKIDTNGNVTSIKPSVGQIEQPTYLKVMSNGDIIFSEQQSHLLKKLTPDNRVSILAGQENIAGSDNGPASSAKFNSPRGIATDDNGNFYLADNSTIRKITANGEVSTIAGSGSIVGSTDGIGNAARFYNPKSIVTDRSGNIFVADMSNHVIRKISTNGQVSLFAGTVRKAGEIDGAGNIARFEYPLALAIDSSDNLYVTGNNDFVRKITPQGMVSSIISSWANNRNYEVKISTSEGIVIDNNGNLFISASSKGVIYKVTPSGATTEVAGGEFGNQDGTGTSAKFNYPGGMVQDISGNLYVADILNHNIRKITPSGVVTTLAGSSIGLVGTKDGVGLAASFNYPTRLAIDKAGNIFVTDTGNRTIRKITPDGSVSTVAGTATLGNLLPYSIKTLGNVWGITFDNAGKFYVAMDQGVFQLHF
ncbi:hypothetical protein [Undibacterium seohonense]|nr:hypothetical protein [Undibacterium seohonense]